MLLFVSCTSDGDHQSERRSAQPPKPYTIEVVPDEAEREFTVQQLEQAYARFVEMFGVAPVLRVFVYDTEDAMSQSPLLAYANHPSILLFKSRRLIQSQSVSPIPGEFSVLAHEATHKLVMSMAELLIHYAGVNVQGRRLDTYGHALAPDWLEEAVAILAEKPEEGAQRLEYLRENPGDLIPLRRLLEMDHPYSGEAAQRLAASLGKELKGLTLLEPPEEMLSLARMYYGQVHALGHYIWETEGPQFFRTALLAAVRGEPVDAIFASAQTIPRTIEELESAYLATVFE